MQYGRDLAKAASEHGKSLASHGQDLVKSAAEHVESVANTTLGESKSLGLTLVNMLIGNAPERAQAVELFRHYVESQGTPYELEEIPQQWRDWIVKQTKGRPGNYKNLNPYGKGMYDLQNALGHFDVKVAKGKDGKKTYTRRRRLQRAAVERHQGDSPEPRV
jgi:hypothetical protein